jgi:putative SOS response-associated peptidase YedK
MCGRYVRKWEPKKVAELLGVKDGEENWTQSYNVAPSATIPVVVADQSGRHMVSAVWGFISSMPGRGPLFNARGETVHKLPTFEESFRSRRCLVPASGFYEWRQRDRQPFYFERQDGYPMAFAGIWEMGSSGHLHATVITTTPNREMGEIHDRMPVILELSKWNHWLNAAALSDVERRNLLAPSPDETLIRWPVSPAVGSVRNDHPELLNRVEEAGFTPDLFTRSAPDLRSQ